MANTQTSTSQKSRGRAQAKQQSGSSRAGRASSTTDERDDTYALISVIYHALQGAETIGRYIEDAQKSDNEDLAAFFEECKGRQNEIAMKGKRLLGEQLYESMDAGDDEDDEDDDD
jgi:DUF917 family protein